VSFQLVPGRPVLHEAPLIHPVRVTLLAAVAYLLIILCVWGIFATSSGMAWETYLTVYSESSPGWRGFFYWPDPTRIHNATFFHTAYWLGEAAGMRGSFFTYQVVYALLLWTRSLLAFLIIRRLVPHSAVLPFSIGAILLVHASDFLHQWTGQLHTYGFSVWLLLAIYMLIVALDQTTTARIAIYATLAYLSEHMCVWTQEGPLFIVLSAPLVLAYLVRPKSFKRCMYLFAAWYVLPVFYLYLTYQKYLLSAGNSYQEGLIRKTFLPGAIVGDWFFNIRYSLSFWSWEPSESHIAQGQIVLLASGAVLVFALASLVCVRWERPTWIQTSSFRDSRVWRLLSAGLIFLVLSFPAYVLLAEPRQLRRTQLLSSFAAAIVLGAVIDILARLVPRIRWRPVLAILLALPIMFVGAYRTIERGGSHRWEWQTHLQTMRQILRVVPAVKEGTIVVMTNIPKDADAFSNSAFWFNLSLRLMYPRTTVGGIYYYSDNSPAPANNLRLHGDQWEFTGVGVAPMIVSGSISQTLVIEYDRSGTARILGRIPSVVCNEQCSEQVYDPQSRVVNAPPAPEALRRYGPL